MTKAARFTSADLTRAVKAMAKAGCAITGAKINPATGEITVLTGSPEAANDARNPLDRVLSR